MLKVLRKLDFGHCKTEKKKRLPYIKDKSRQKIKVIGSLFMVESLQGSSMFIIPAKTIHIHAAGLVAVSITIACFCGSVVCDLTSTPLS